MPKGLDLGEDIKAALLIMFRAQMAVPTDKEIAHQYGITSHTVRAHRTKFRRLGLLTRMKADGRGTGTLKVDRSRQNGRTK